MKKYIIIGLIVGLLLGVLLDKAVQQQRKSYEIGNQTLILPKGAILSADTAYNLWFQVEPDGKILFHNLTGSKKIARK